MLCVVSAVQGLSVVCCQCCTRTECRVLSVLYKDRVSCVVSAVQGLSVVCCQCCIGTECCVLSVMYRD